MLTNILIYKRIIVQTHSHNTSKVFQWERNKIWFKLTYSIFWKGQWSWLAMGSNPAWSLRHTRSKSVRTQGSATRPSDLTSGRFTFRFRWKAGRERDYNDDGNWLLKLPVCTSCHLRSRPCSNVFFTASAFSEEFYNFTFNLRCPMTPLRYLSFISHLGLAITRKI